MAYATTTLWTLSVALEGSLSVSCLCMSSVISCKTFDFRLRQASQATVAIFLRDPRRRFATSRENEGRETSPWEGNIGGRRESAFELIPRDNMVHGRSIAYWKHLI